MKSRAAAFSILALAVIPLALLGCFGCGKTVPTDGGNNTVPVNAEMTKAIEALEAAEPNSEGASFVKPVMDVWKDEFSEKTKKKVKINYQSTGSGAGISQMTKKLVVFGCTDAPMTAEQLADAKKIGGDVIHVPLVIGAVVPVYNLAGVEEPLKFTGPLLAEIFTGKITKWNDSKLVELNPVLKDKDVNIQPVYRSDPSGTSFIFTDYLSKVGDGVKFRETVGASQTPNWPMGVGIRQPKSAGVAGHITRTPGSIGYIELTYALDSKEKMKYGSVKNEAGKMIAADAESITAAADATLGLPQKEPPYSLHELTYNLTNAPGEKSYPIAGMSFAIIYKKQEGANGKAIVTFLRWATSAEGQDLAKKRNYAPLPPALQDKVKSRLDAVEIQ